MKKYLNSVSFVQICKSQFVLKSIYFQEEPLESLCNNQYNDI